MAKGAFGDMFKSQAERKKELERKQKRAIRRLEGVVGVFDEMIAKQIANSQRAWDEAREAVRVGNRPKATICLQKYRSYQSRLYAFQRKKFVFENYTERLNEMILDNEIGGAMKVVNSLINVDVDDILDTVSNVDEQLTECDALGQEWDRRFGNEIRSTNGLDADYLPNMDALFSQLESEAVGGITGGGVPQTVTNPATSQILDELDKISKS